MTKTIMQINSLCRLGFLGENQSSALKQVISGEDGELIAHKIDDLFNLIGNMPSTYGQDGLGEQSIAYLHYFGGGMDAYITEKDSGKKQIQVFGLVYFGNNSQLGYMPLAELTDGMELELFWTPKTINEIQDFRTSCSRMDTKQSPPPSVMTNRAGVNYIRAMVNGKWTMLREKEHEEWLKKWCGFCQNSPCIGEGCRLQGKKLARLGFLSSWAYRSDSEQAEVEELSKEFPDTGWPIVPRKESP